MGVGADLDVGARVGEGPRHPHLRAARAPPVGARAPFLTLATRSPWSTCTGAGIIRGGRRRGSGVRGDRLGVGRGLGIPRLPALRRAGPV